MINQDAGLKIRISHQKRVLPGRLWLTDSETGFRLKNEKKKIRQKYFKILTNQKAVFLYSNFAPKMYVARFQNKNRSDSFLVKHILKLQF